jgi:ligand-binding sensor domain-containing protein
MKKFFSFIFVTIILLLPINVLSSNLKSKMVTYANFSYVRDVASTISHVYFATTSGIIRYNKMEDSWEEPLTNNSNINHNDIFRVYPDRFDNKLFAATPNGNFEYDIIFKSWFPVKEIPIIDNDYVRRSAPDVMFAPPGEVYSPDGYVVDKFGRQFGFETIIDDKSGNLWIGTWGYGPAWAPTYSNVIEYLPYGLLQNRVDALFNDNGTLFISGESLGAFRSGISVFYPDDNWFDHIESGVDGFFGRHDINCFEANDKYLYAGTDLGLLIFNRETFYLERQISERSGLPGNIVYSLELKGDSLFVGTSNGLGFLNIGNDSLSYVKPQQFTNIEIYDLATTDSSLWLATSSGAYQLKYGSGLLQKFQDPYLIIFSQALQVEYFKNRIWFSSETGMVSMDLETGETEPYKNLKPRFNRNSIAINDKIAVITTDIGFKIIYYKRKTNVIEREFTESDGLPSSYINTLLLDGDYLWIGTDKGLTRFLWNDPFRVD